MGDVPDFMILRRKRMITGLRRTMIYVPGESERMIQKSAACAADVLILNLEDGVAAAMKDQARQNISQALGQLDFGSREVVVRVNPIASETGRRDLAEIVPCTPDGIVLPKIESQEEIIAADEAVKKLEAAHGLPEGRIKFHAMIESAKGVLLSYEIASAARVSSLIFGSADYIKDLRCRPGVAREELLLALQMIVTAARAAGIDAIDSPCFNLQDPKVLQQEAEQARKIGFDGKSVLHPSQILPIHQAFEFTAEETAWAEQVLKALSKAEDGGRALTVMGDNLIDNPHQVLAEYILKRVDLVHKFSR
jgi:citrate lyase subunit beta/citryl-CoA lyase